MQGCGSWTVARILESPSVLAGKPAVETFVTVAEPSAPIVWQLTIALNGVTGLVPCSAGGTGACSASTRPRTRTFRWPSRSRDPRPLSIIQGRPPPGTPRMGFDAPTYGPVTGAIGSNFRIVPGSALAAVPRLASATSTAKPAGSASRPIIFTDDHLPCAFGRMPTRSWHAHNYAQGLRGALPAGLSIASSPAVRKTTRSGPIEAEIQACLASRKTVPRMTETVGALLRIHTGEIELIGTDIGGIGVHIAARVSALATRGELLVSSTVRDLVAGSGIRFEHR